ncbi:MAG: DUF883 C-terminal domain-containing protein [Acidobacteriota bacterium]
MLESEFGNVIDFSRENPGKCLMIAGGAGFLVGFLFGSRTFSRTIQLVVTKTLINKLLDRVSKYT